MSQRIEKANVALDADLLAYTNAVFADDNIEFSALTQAAEAAQIPTNQQVAPEVGRLLQFLCRSVRARRVLEFGTLAGYSALYLASALPPDGTVLSLESNPDYAAFARIALAKTPHGAKVTVREGDALALLPALRQEAIRTNAPFDLIFLDADKIHYPQFLEWAGDPLVLRPGGLLVADNVLHSSSWGGQKPNDPAADDARVIGVRIFNQRLAADSRFTSMILPIRDGVAVAVFEP